ncbi:MAG: hypothetical protein M4D80_02485 [Myxococcota bacterium]|nr:hypothetical protein [Myxococcota bacterium]
MRLAAVLAVLAFATPARADDSCDVRVVRAPKHVRAAIEARVGIESGCTPLEIRVVKKRRKYQVTAKLEDGETRSGEVRDAGLVAELVMKWAAPAQDPAPAPEPVAAQEPPPPLVSEAEPSPFEPSDQTFARVELSAPSRESGRDIAVGVLATPITYGIRAEGDVLAWRGFSLGVALGASDAVWSTGDAMTGASLDLRDITGAVVAAKTFGTGAWRLRIQGGIGLVYTRYSAKTRTAPFEPIAEGDGTTSTFEAAITLSREISSSWAVSVGPLMTYFAQQFSLDAMRRPLREYDVGGYLAIRKRL